MNLFHKKKSSLGVDIGAHGIKVVELHQTKGRPQLWTYGIADAELDIHVPTEAPSPEINRIDQYANLLRQLLQEAKVSTRHATVSLPVSHVFHAVMTLPMASPPELAAQVNAKAKNMLSRPIEEMQLVHQVIPDKDAAMTGQKLQKVLVTAAPKAMVSFYSSIFAKAGLTLDELETEAFALERALVGQDKAVVMVVDIGSERTNFFIMDNGLPLTERSIQLGGKDIDRILMDQLGLPMPAIGQIKRDLGQASPNAIPTEIFLPVIEPMVKEIQYSFDLYLQQLGNKQKQPEKIILTGGAAVFPPIVKAIHDAFQKQLRVFVGDPWARVVYQQGMKTVLDGIGPRMAVTIGLALRNIIKE